METTIEFLIRAFFMGAVATLTMDGWAWLLRRFGIPSLNFAYLGRWGGHLFKRRWFHPQGISRSESIDGERLIGWCMHYAIGVGFAGLLLMLFGLEWGRNPTLMPALLVGLGTVLAPWLILQPALGAGVASLKTSSPFFNAFKSLVTHAVYGMGLFIAASILASWKP